MTLLHQKKWIVPVGICVLAFGGLQFFRPTVENPPVTGDLTAPAPVKEILQKACYDCHSNETRLKWFDHISPGIWLVASDVQHARGAMNFSNWDKLSKDQQKAKLFESLNQATFGTMPPAQYTALHPSAKLTAQDIAVLKEYLATQIPKTEPTPQRAATADNQFATWTHGAAANDVQPSPNGIDYIADYKNWETISSSDRPDTGTMKIITGNDIAIKAVREHKTNPWPDGAILAKLQYEASADANGTVHNGVFKQVGFMVKDSKKYSKTQGWGYAKWNGTKLEQPYKDASFATECVNCHAPMHDSDFVFTNGIDFSAGPLGAPSKSDLVNKAASLPKTPLFDTHGWKVITSFTDRSHGTTYMLFGNDSAAQAARAGQTTYPQGAVLSLVAWKSAEDENWFGATVPGALQSVEQVTFSTEHPTYDRYDGPALNKAPADPAAADARVAYIVQQRASIMP
ncbi:cytochrome P460 family protein [Pendulispora rubella]|uniref:cytochrome P460 family protein n=1 Tax=Pendulispora rubella TaxID=2741070 RepID=UPI00374E0D7D